MKTRNNILTLLCFFFCFVSFSFGQVASIFDVALEGHSYVTSPSANSMTLVNQIEAGADLYTGKAKASIPITSLQSYDISVPVMLSYANNGIKVNDMGSLVGLGWDLQAGGKITRVMNNLPDEFTGKIKGWANNRIWNQGSSGSVNIDGYGYLFIKDELDYNLEAFYVYPTDKREDIVNSSNWKSCDNCNIGIDTDPDEFYFSFGGYSGKFVFDQDGNIHTIPDMDFRILPKIDIDATGITKITEFIVITPDGMKYIFGGSDLNAVEESQSYEFSLANIYHYTFDSEYPINPNPNGPPLPVETYRYKIAPDLKIEETIRSFDFGSFAFAESFGNVPIYDGYRLESNNRSGYFTSTWHLKKIISPSNDLMTFDYDSEIYRYTQNRSYSWNMPDFKVVDSPSGKLFESKKEPIDFNFIEAYDKIYPEQSTFTYNVVELGVKGRRLRKITTSNNQAIEFIPSEDDRVDLPGAKALEEIQYQIGGIQQKSWKLGYHQSNLLTANGPEWIQIEGPNGIMSDDRLATEDIFDLRYGLNEGISGIFMSSFKSLTETKFRLWGIDVPIEVYYGREYRKIWKPEHNRFFLNKITEVSSFGYEKDLVSLEYNSTQLPRRFSYKQDKFGYYSGNTRSTLLQKPPFLNLENFRTLAYEDIQTLENEYEGYNGGFAGNANANSRRYAGSLTKIKFNTGASKSFVYGLNSNTSNYPNGIRLNSIIVQPNGSPFYVENYSYEGDHWIAQGGVNPDDHESLRRFKLPLNEEDDQWVLSSQQVSPIQMTKGSILGYKKVTVSYGAVQVGNNGSTEYTFLTPFDFPNIKPDQRYFTETLDVDEPIETPYRYPYAPYTNMDYKRGLVKNIVVRDASDNLLTETTNNYNFNISGYSPSFIYGLKSAKLERYYTTNQEAYDIFYTDRYRFISDRYQLNSTTTKNYAVGDSENALTTIKNYDYNDSHHLQSETINSSTGETFKTEYVRISDILGNGYQTYMQGCLDDFWDCLANGGGLSCTGSYNACLNNYSGGTALQNEMVSRNMTATVIETNSYVNGIQTSGTKMDYKTGWTTCATCILPEKSYTYEDGWELKQTINSVNSHGQPLEVSREHYDDPVAFEWTTDGLLDKKSYADWEWDYSFSSISRRLLGITDVDLQNTSYYYDTFGKLKQISERNGLRKTNISYDYAGINGTGENYSLTEVIAGGITVPPIKETFDGLGRPLSTIQQGYTPDNNDYIVSNEYDGLGRVILSADQGQGASTEIEYDASPLNRVIKQSIQGAPTSTHTKYELNSSSDNVTGYAPYTLFKTTVIDENGYPTETYTDGIGRTVLLRKYVDGNEVNTSYSFNAKGELETITQPNGEIFEYTYYPDGLLHTKSFPGGGITTYEYNNKNQLWKETDANGNTLEYSYNEYDQPTVTSLDGNVIISNAYYSSGVGKKGRLQSTTSASLSNAEEFITSSIYDSYGRLETQSVENSTSNDDYNFSYDHRDLIQSELRTHTGPEGTLDITKGFKYDHAGRLDFIDMTVGNNPTERIVQNVYNNRDWLTQKKLGVDGTGQLQSVDYTYNYRGWLLKINDVGECIDLGPGPNSPNPGEDNFNFEGNVEVNYNASEIVNNQNTNIEVKYDMTMSLLDGTPAYQVDNDGSVIIGGVSENSTNYTSSQQYLLSGEVDPEVLSIAIKDDIVTDANSLGNGDVVSQERGEEIRNKLQRRIDEVPRNGDCTNEDGDLFAQQMYYDNVLPIPELNNQRQFNGNISMMKWRVMVPGRDAVDYYGYNYDGVYEPGNTGINSTNDGLGRFKTATFAQKSLQAVPQGVSQWINPGRYNVDVAYADATGNIGKITRNGVIGGTGSNLSFGITDDLNFTHDSANPNRLSSVAETGNDEHGFKGTSKSYGYDDNGNIINMSTSNGQTGTSAFVITYNHLNLPNVIDVAGETIGKIQYQYDASGRKLAKLVDGIKAYTRHYANGIEYKDDRIEFISNEAGRFLYQENVFQYVIKDHLGNSRVSFMDINGDGEITTEGPDIEVAQENHYYPFGMNMEGNWTSSIEPLNNYLYNYKEVDSDFDLNWAHYGFRMYDPSIARFTGIDPIGDDFSWASTYNYAENSVPNGIDLWGLQLIKQQEINNNANAPVGADGPVVLPDDALIPSSQESDIILESSPDYERLIYERDLSIIKKAWDSEFVRNITGDALSTGIELNIYPFVGGSEVPAGMVFILHGPEAFTIRKFSDAGAGFGFGANFGGFLNRTFVHGRPDQITGDVLEGFRFSSSIDIGEGIVTGLNYGFSIPTNESTPLTSTFGFSYGVGGTSPVGLGGYANFGYTFIWD